MGALRTGRRSDRRAAKPAARSNRSNVFHRSLRCEILEDRCLLALAPLNVALVNDAIAQAQQVRDAAAMETTAIVYRSDSMTTTGLDDLDATASSLMSARLPTDVRRLADKREIDLIFAKAS